MNHISHYHADDAMSLLVCDNPQILPLLVHFNIPLGFADKDIESVCQENNIHLTTFLAIVNIILCGDKSEHINYENISTDTLIDYLRSSHDYYINKRFPQLYEQLLASLDDGNVSKLVLRYFSEYVDELRDHQSYEDQVVFKYINALSHGEDTDGYIIDMFSEKHDNIDEKLSELKDVMIKYLPSPSSDALVLVIGDIFRCSREIQSHNNIEDFLLVPLIKHLELKNK